jgi:hypothetical protein
VVTEETTFDQGSVEFIEPVDMYNPGETNDKYLVFPKTNILGEGQVIPPEPDPEIVEWVNNSFTIVSWTNSLDNQVNWVKII